MLDDSRIFFLPIMSDNLPAGRLTRIPGIVDAAAIKPRNGSGIPMNLAKGFRTGFFDNVELKIAKNPMMHNIKKKLATVLLGNLSDFAINIESSFLVKLKIKLFFFLHHP